MSITIVPKNQVSELVRKSFGVDGNCTRDRSIVDIQPPDKSPTAKLIFSLLTKANASIQIAFIDQTQQPDIVSSCYDSDYKAVFIRADVRYGFKEYKDKTGKYIEMPPIVLLYHELGHAKQDVVDGTFARLVAAGQTKDKEKGGLPEQTGGPTGNTNVKLEKRGKAIKMVEANSTLGGAGGYHVDYNNMRLHEYPICMELELPIRSTYKDIVVI